MHVGPSAFRAYGIALLAVSLALLVRALMDPVLGDRLPYYLLYFSLIAATAYGGIGPGVAALVVGFLSASYLFAAPRYSFDLGENPEGAFRFLTLGAVIAIVGGWARLLLEKWKREVHERRQNELSTRRELEHTYSTLASIGDGLIATDTTGHVTFMNEVAEKLSGWAMENAQGKSIDQVFRIVNLQTRQSVTSSALRALHNGGIMTLPEHTSLVDRYGADHLINDSAAPIRDRANRIIGSVLVFRKVAEKDDLFSVQGINLVPTDRGQQPLPPEERGALERACRTWLYQEWKPRTAVPRFASLQGFDLIISEEITEELPSGATGIRFRVEYSR